MWIALSCHSLRCTGFGPWLAFQTISFSSISATFAHLGGECPYGTAPMSCGFREQDGGSAIVEKSAEMVI